MKKLTKKLKDKHSERKAKKQAQEAAEEPKNKEVPNITAKDVAEHRDEVLRGARKYIYPLQHSKHKIITISLTVFVVTLLGFFSYCTWALYKQQSSSAFLYRVTQVIPFPVVRVGGRFVSYENYLFELRRYVHYYETQQKLDFQNNEFDKQQLDEFKKRALDKVVDLTYIKQLAKENNITVSNQEVQDEITLLQEQNRLGGDGEVLEDVIKDYFGWSRSDFERYLKEEILTQKVVAALDPSTSNRASEAYKELQGGKKFSKVAKKYSDDVTSKNNGGEFGFLIDKSNRDITPEATDTLFDLKEGQYSEVINTGYSLEIFRLMDKKSGGRVQAAHILFNFKDIDAQINDLKEEQPARVYITSN